MWRTWRRGGWGFPPERGRTPLPGWSELVRHDIAGDRCPVSSWNRYVDTTVEARAQPVLEGLPSGEVVDLDREDAVVWRGGRRSGQTWGPWTSRRLAEPRGAAVRATTARPAPARWRRAP